MTIKCVRNSGFAQITFTWNEDLTDCRETSLGVSDQELSYLLDNKAHEGSDVLGWEVKIDF